MERWVQVIKLDLNPQKCVPSLWAIERREWFFKGQEVKLGELPLWVQRVRNKRLVSSWVPHLWEGRKMPAWRTDAFIPSSQGGHSWAPKGMDRQYGGKK